MRNNRGFTMIELMITITILATLTLLTAQAIQQAIQTKVKLQGQIDDVSRMRDTVRLIERDINLAYHYRDIEKELNDLMKKKPTGGNSGSGGGATDGGGPGGGFVTPGGINSDLQAEQANQERREVPRRDPVTHFVGNGESVNFPTMNNARTVRNSRQADFVEVGYALRDCKSLREGNAPSKCLWRRSSPHVDLDITKGGDEVALLENVSEFKLRYMGKGKQDWVSDWRTDAQGDGVTKNKFPQAVEISITVEKTERGKAKKYSMQIVAPIHFPNNAEEGGNTNGRQQGTTGSDQPVM